MTKEQLLNKLESRTRIDSKIRCKLWTGAITARGYGLIYIEGKLLYVHRLSAHIFHNLDLNDKNRDVLHKPECPNKHCWNEQHLYIGDNWDNQQDRRRKEGPNRKFGSASVILTHCRKREHEFTEENTGFHRNGNRFCKECVRIRVRKNREYAKQSRKPPSPL